MIYPEVHKEVADALAELLKAKMPNGSYVIKKDHRITVLKAEILLRRMK